MDYIKAMLEKAGFAIWKSQDNIVRYYNQWHISISVLNPDNKIFYNTIDIHITYLSDKLSHCYLGSYTVKKNC